MSNKKKTRKISAKSIFSGSVLSNERFIRRLPIVGFVGLLMIIYMAIGFTVQRKHNQIEKLTNEITKLRTISATTSAVRQQLTRQQNIEELIKKFNLQLILPTTPPHIIAAPKSNKE